MGKSIISMAMFNSYVKIPEGNYRGVSEIWYTMELNGYFYGDNYDNPVDLKVHYFQSNP
jgi:hypothetical protein